jgi:diguanylate cyclase (GGDEF)-like protein
MTEASDPWLFFPRLQRALSTTDTPEAFMAEVLAEIHAVPGVAACWFAAPGGNGAVVPLAWRGDGAPTGDAPGAGAPGAGSLPPPEAPCHRGVALGRPLFIDDLWAVPPSQKPLGEATPLHWRATVSIPLSAGLAAGSGAAGSGAAGVLVVQSINPGFFSRAWPADMLARLAAIIGPALESRRTRQALNRSRTLYQALFAGADMLLKARTENKVLGRLCQLLVDSGLFMSVTIGQLDRAGIWRHRSVAARHNARALRNAAPKHRGDDKDPPLNLLAWHARKTLIANRYASDPRFAKLQLTTRKVGIEAVASMIIERGGRRWAVLSVTAGEPDFFDAEIIGLLERLAGMVGHRLDEFDLKAALRNEREIQSQIARRDALTELPNRLAFQERLEAAVGRASRNQGSLLVTKIDLDDFKQINDLWGRAAGDAVLRAIAGRLRALLPHAFIARTGGDEFALYQEGWRWTDDLAEFCNRLHDGINEPLALPNGEVVHLTLCAGFTIYPADPADADLLMRHTYMALCAAKAGKGRADTFWRQYLDITPGASEPHYGRALLESGALRLHYQPMLDLSTGAIVGVEALARMQDADELIPPAKFLHDLVLDDRMLLFHQVLETALRQLQLWDAEGINLSVSVNVDAQILLLGRTLPYLRDKLAKSGIAPNRLVLEILETHDFIDLKNAKRHIEAVRALGLRIALDDLGAGYSSLLKIRELPLDVVKLDRAFVAGLRERPDDLMFIAAFQTLTSALGISLVVEGVENAEVLDALRITGARFAQGYAIARPMPGEALSAFLHAYRPIRPSRVPVTLLGAYADHLGWLRAIQFAQNRQEVVRFLRTANPFALDEYFATNHLADTPMGDAYQTLRALLQFDCPDRQVILDAAEHFGSKIKTALKAHC